MLNLRGKSLVLWILVSGSGLVFLLYWLLFFLIILILLFERLDFLEVLDDLYLAGKELKNEGLNQVIKKFEEMLKKYGVEKIEIGGKFDPMSQEVVEGTEGDNIEEVRAGYTMHERVIRPARVRIVK